MRNFISPISWGLGDLIVSLPAVQGLVADGTPTWLVTRSELQVGLAERIPGLAGTVSEAELPDVLQPQIDHYYNLREHPIQTDYWWGSPEFERDYGGFRINDILELICRDLLVPADFAQLVSLTCNRKPEFAETVAFIPGSDGAYKCWQSEHWQALRGDLLQRGMHCTVIGEPDKSPQVRRLIQCGMSWTPTPMLADALDILSSCSAVVGVDTGLMHLAVHQGTPTIALFRENPIYYREYPGTTALVGKSCAPECLSRSLTCTNNSFTELSTWAPKTWSCAVADAERCMNGITPAMVLQSLDELLGTAHRELRQHSIPGRPRGAGY